MAEILLQELSNADIDWMVTTGQQEKVTAGTLLLHPSAESDAIYLLLDGVLSLISPNCNDGQGREIARLLRGEVVGIATLLDAKPTSSAIKVNQDSIVLKITRSQIQTKLRQDRQFAAHFYRAIALILAERLRRMYERPELLSFEDDQSAKEALFVFGELQDGDIDWLVASGKVEKLAPGNVLLHAGRPVDALYVILDGLLSIAVPEGDYDSLSLCFTGLERAARPQRIIANFSKGELPGIAACLDFQPLPVTIRAVNEALVFTVPRQKLVVKLQQDVGFASRFYRAIALQMLDLLRTVMDRLGCTQKTYTQSSNTKTNSIWTTCSKCHKEQIDLTGWSSD